MKIIVLFLIKFYMKLVSPLFPPKCRFYPCCSKYSLIAVERFGVIRGGWLAIKRISKCHPFNRGGVDHVPEIWPDKRRKRPLRRS